MFWATLMVLLAGIVYSLVLGISVVVAWHTSGESSHQSQWSSVQSSSTCSIVIF